MEEASDPEAGRNFAERIIRELRGMRQDLDMLTTQVSILTDCAGLLLRPMDETDVDSPLQAMLRSMDLLVAGTEVTHKSLEAMNAALFDKKMDSALWVATTD